jgi:hypothetical protein
MSRTLRNFIAALMLSIAVLSLASTTLVRVAHADTDCSADENKDKDECKK